MGEASLATRNLLATAVGETRQRVHVAGIGLWLRSTPIFDKPLNFLKAQPTVAQGVLVHEPRHTVSFLMAAPSPTCMSTVLPLASFVAGCESEGLTSGV